MFSSRPRPCFLPTGDHLFSPPRGSGWGSGQGFTPSRLAALAVQLILNGLNMHQAGSTDLIEAPPDRVHQDDCRRQRTHRPRAWRSHRCEPGLALFRLRTMRTSAPNTQDDRRPWSSGAVDHTGELPNSDPEPGTTWSRRHDLASAARRALERVADGRLQALPLTLRFWDGSTLVAQDAGASGPIVLLNGPQALRYLVHEPNQVGLARAWVTGAVDVEGDLEEVLRARSRISGISISPADRLRLAWASLRTAGPSLLRRPPVPRIEAGPARGGHSPAADRKAVRHHYDVSNDFYRLILGPSMTYSCGYFSSPADTLEAAQAQKHELISRKLRLAPGERLLDIGCGWASMLIHAATNHGVRGVGVTLSEPQAELARARIREAGLEHHLEVRVADYREIRDGPFDKIVSIGMYEHVGRLELDNYARTVHGLLRPGGLFLNHGIARLYSEAARGDTFISRYIFPGGELHPVSEIVTSMQTAGLEVRDIESIREHYPLTLRRWAANLNAHHAEAIASAGHERERAWRLYMLGCAQAFDEGEITVYQTLGARAGAPHGLPLQRSTLLSR
jgi:cyclopropane-fatty-acyl-phospholipid synthase